MRTMNSVLLVEDFGPFRAFVSTLLREKPDVQVVSEASDGLEAVQYKLRLFKSYGLKSQDKSTLHGHWPAWTERNRGGTPDSRASPQIQNRLPHQEGSSEVVEEALSSGAQGYVHKPRAANDLFPAVAAVLEGKQFVSNGLIGSKEPMITLRARNHRPCLQETPCLR